MRSSVFDFSSFPVPFFQRTLVIVFSMFFLLSCTKNITLSDYLDTTKPVKVTTIRKDTREMLGEKNEYFIEPGTAAYTAFEKWLRDNGKGWRKTVALYEKQVVISQDRIELVYMGYYAAITLRDITGSKQHLSKTIEEGSLDFMIPDH